MADGKEVLEFTLIYGSRKYPISIPLSEHESPTVETLSQIAEKNTQVPMNSQKIIFKGKSLQDKHQSLVVAGIKKGSKVMILGKRYDPEEDENMKSLRSAEQQVDANEKKLTSCIEELNGIQNGFLQQHLVKEAVATLSKRINSLVENLMKILESLDALVLNSLTLEIKGKRKTIIKRIQTLMSKADTEEARCDALLKGVNL